MAELNTTTRPRRISLQVCASGAVVANRHCTTSGEAEFMNAFERRSMHILGAAFAGRFEQQLGLWAMEGFTGCEGALPWNERLCKRTSASCFG